MKNIKRDPLPVNSEYYLSFLIIVYCKHKNIYATRFLPFGHIIFFAKMCQLQYTKFKYPLFFFIKFKTWQKIEIKEEAKISRIFYIVFFLCCELASSFWFFENNVFNKIDFDNLKTHYNTLVNPLMIVQWVE